MADKKNFNLTGIGSNVQYGKSGGRIRWTTDHLEARNPTDSGFADIYVPLTPGNDQAATSKSYVDEFTTTLVDAKNSVRVATTADGPFATAYDDGSSVDAVVLDAGDRILIKDQSDGTENGIYIVQTIGNPPVRANDFNTDAEATFGAFCHVVEGTQNALRVFVVTTADPITLGVTAIDWAEGVATAVVILDAKDSVRVATTVDAAIATEYENGDTVDDIVLVTGDRILLKDQSTGAENGIYVVNVSGSPTRASDADTDAEVTQGAFCFVVEGTANEKKSFLLTTSDPIIVDTDAQVWEEVSGGGGGGNSFGIVTGDSGTATADIETDTLQLQGATSGGITTVGSDAPELITFSITPIDLATTGATMASGDFIIVSDSADSATILGQKITFANAFNDLGVPFTGGTLDLADFLPLIGGTMTGALVADDAGLVATPDISWTGDLDTGLAQIGVANTLSIVGGGARVAEFDGSVSTPVNYITFASSATANAPIISNAGADTNGVGLGLTILGKTASASGDGGPIIITGGVGNNTGVGGAITFTGGDSAGASGTAGSVTIDAGAPAGGTAGTVTIAGTDATTLTLGSTSFPVATTAIGILALTAADTLGAVNATTGGATQQLLQFDDSGDTFSWIDKSTVGGAGAIDDLDIKLSVRVATTADITLSGEQTIDDILTSTDRILVKDQSTGSENGIYVTDAGSWTRATDSDADSKVTQGSVVFIAEGTANEKTSFILITVDPITVGSTAQVWESAGGGGGGSSTFTGLTDTPSSFTGESGTRITVNNSENALVFEGTQIKDPVTLATTANITLSSEQTIDNVNTSTDRILVKNQSTNVDNGIYITAAGAWTRTDDFDDDKDAVLGCTVAVNEGIANAQTMWQLANTTAVIIGSTAQTWTQIGDGASTIQTTDATKVNIIRGLLSSGEVATIRSQGQGIETLTGDVYWFTISGAVKNIGGTTSIIGTPIITEDSDLDASSWTAGLEADDAANAWELTVTGQASKTIEWKSSFKEVKQLQISLPLTGALLLGSYSYDTFMKPASWSINPALIEPSWDWFWGHAKFVLPMWDTADGDKAFIEWVTGNQSREASVEVVSTNRGLAVNQSGQGNARGIIFDDDVRWDVDGDRDLTWMLSLDFTGTDGNAPAWVAKRTGSGFSGGGWIVNSSGNPGDPLFQFRGASATQTVTWAGAFPAFGPLTIVVTRKKGGTFELWHNGISKGTRTNATNFDSGGQDIHITAQLDSGRRMEGDYHCFYLLDGIAVSDGQIQQFHRDPFGPLRMYGEAAVAI